MFNLLNINNNCNMWFKWKQPRWFYLTGGITNLYSIIRGSMEWPFSELFLFLSDASLYNQYKFIAFNILSWIILIIYCKILLIITVISNKTTNELTIYAKLCQNVTILTDNSELLYVKCRKSWGKQLMR